MSMIERFSDPTPRAEMERRWKAVRERMSERGLDALIVQGANNLAAGGGYFRWFTGLGALPNPAQTLVVPADGLMTLVSHGAAGRVVDLDDRDETLPGVGRRLFTANFPMVRYTGQQDAEAVAAEITRAGFQAVGLVGANAMYHGFASGLQRRAGNVRWSDASDLVDDARAIKSEAEIDFIRRAAAMQDDIFARIGAFIQPGMRDFEVMAYAYYLGQTMGSQTGYFLGSSAAAGEPTPMLIRPFHGRTLREGDTLLLQAENSGPGGYFVHIARHFTLGKAPAELTDGFAEMVEAQDFTVSLLSAGARCDEILAVYNDYMGRRGFPPERRVHCHGQGCDAVERPLAHAEETMTIAPDMNIGIHPSLSTERLFVTVCDNFLTRSDGIAERLHKTPRAIVELN